ncbi:MAG: class I SAM-dependent methyltransferase [Candidatus Paceibacterota bacterium]
MMSYEENKKYFKTAYKTGSDIWTHKNYRAKVFEYISYIPKGGFVLDLGSGRGVWPFILVDFGFKAIGIDYVAEMVKANNQEVKFKGLSEKMRFVEGDIFDIQFADQTFDVVTDFGLAQHLNDQDFPQYQKEVDRVLKPGGHILNVSLSKNTKKFLDFSPANSESGEFQVNGVHYYFFTDEEILDIYGENMRVINQEHIVPENHDEIFVITLLQKNS